MHIAVDCDDVLVAFWPRIVEAYNLEYGHSLRVEDTRSWDDNPIKCSAHFGKGKAYKTWWDWLRDRHWLWSTCEAIPGALGALAELQKQGHYIELLTHKPAWARREMTSWLAKWHPAFDRLTFVEPGISKVSQSDALVLIDDKPKNVKEWRTQGRISILFEQPWNADTSLTGVGIGFRCKSWSEVLQTIAKIEGAYV